MSLICIYFPTRQGFLELETMHWSEFVQHSIKHWRELAHVFFSSVSLLVFVRAAWNVVCKAWVPSLRFRFHLFPSMVSRTGRASLYKTTWFECKCIAKTNLVRSRICNFQATLLIPEVPMQTFWYSARCWIHGIYPESFETKCTTEASVPMLGKFRNQVMIAILLGRVMFTWSFQNLGVWITSVSSWRSIVIYWCITSLRWCPSLR